MIDKTLAVLRGITQGRRAGSPDLIVEPFLHVDPGHVYNPLTDRRLAHGDPDYAALRALLGGRSVSRLSRLRQQRLRDQGWIVPDAGDLARRFYLKHVTLEAHTVCNQACYFCPVSFKPRASYSMPTEFYEQIVAQLAVYRSTIETVHMLNYNEPTLDTRFLDQVRLLRAYGLPPVVNTNGSGLTPERVDALMEMGGLAHLSVNFSTMDRASYARERGQDHREVVMRNLDYVKDIPLAPLMYLAVLGRGDAAHMRNYEEIAAYFAGSQFEVKYFEIMDRAGHLDEGHRPATPHDQLRGCENVGSRPLQHVHITPQGKCVLCCEDYDEQYVVGDLTEQTLEEVLTGDVMARMRRWAYGLDTASDDFICRGCIYARTCAGSA